jgi:hypothetical protein
MLAARAWHRPAEARSAPVAGLGHIPQQRRAKARERAALAAAMAAREAVLDRLAWQIAELRSSVERAAVAHAAVAAELVSCPGASRV